MVNNIIEPSIGSIIVEYLKYQHRFSFRAEGSYTSSQLNGQLTDQIVCSHHRSPIFNLHITSNLGVAISSSGCFSWRRDARERSHEWITWYTSLPAAVMCDWGISCDWSFPRVALPLDQIRSRVRYRSDYTNVWSFNQASKLLKTLGKHGENPHLQVMCPGNVTQPRDVGY